MSTYIGKERANRTFIQSIQSSPDRQLHSIIRINELIKSKHCSSFYDIDADKTLKHPSLAFQFQCRILRQMRMMRYRIVLHVLLTTKAGVDYVVVHLLVLAIQAMVSYRLGSSSRHTSDIE